MSNKIRLSLIFILVLVALILPGNQYPSDMPKPKPEIKKLVKDIKRLDDPVDSAKVSGVFKAMSEAMPDSVDTRVEAQDFFAQAGKAGTGGSLKGKYEDFARSVAAKITSVIGSQTEAGTLTPQQQQKLRDLLYGVSWKLYVPSHRKEFDEARRLTIEYIRRPNDELPEPSECTCQGTGYITHGDGHKTKCPCDECDCESSSGSHQCQCVAPGYVCACEEKYGCCQCP